MSAVAMRDCWSCGQKTPRAERYCAESGADAWNPPQGRNASSHSWRTNDYVRPGTSTTSSHDARSTTSAQGAWRTHATAGILIIATLMAFTYWFWFGIGVAAAFNPPEATRDTVFGDPVDGDYFSTGRVLLAVGLALVMTAITWAIAKEVAEAE